MYGTLWSEMLNKMCLHHFINLIHLEAIIVTRSIIMHITLLDTVYTMYVCVLLLLFIINGITSVNRKAKEDCKGITYCQVIRYGGN